MTETIDSKARNVKLWDAGVFGNTLRMWHNVDDAVKDITYDGPYVLRSRLPDFKVRHGLPSKEALLNAFKELEYKYKPTVYVNEQMPDQLITIQGEVWRGAAPTFMPYMHYSTEKGHMKPCLALKGMSRHIEGTAVKLVLQHYLDVYANVIWDLLELYPDHIVEFSAFSEGIGKLLWPLIVWEVRKY